MRLAVCRRNPTVLNPKITADGSLVPRPQLARHLARDRAMIDLLHVVDAGKDHRGVEFAAEDIDRARDAGLSARAETVKRCAADHGGVRTERERAENILAGANATIDQHFLAAADGVGHF